MTSIRFKQTRQKYGAQPTYVDGIRFASKKEAQRYQQLKLLERAGEIRELELQPRFPLHAAGGAAVRIKSQAFHKTGRHVTYVADFKYYDCRDAHVVVEDTKGMDTPLSRLKRAHVEAEYNVEVRIL